MEFHPSAVWVTSSKLISSKHKDEDCISPPRRDERFLSSPGGYLRCSPKKDTKQNMVFLLEVTLAFSPQNHLQLFVSSWLRCMNGMIKTWFLQRKIFFVGGEKLTPKKTEKETQELRLPHVHVEPGRYATPTNSLPLKNDGTGRRSHSFWNGPFLGHMLHFRWGVTFMNWRVANRWIFNS